MSGIVLSKMRWRWLFTSVAILLLFVVGVLVSLLVGSNQFAAIEFDVNAWVGWRILVYSLLLWTWPFIINGLLKQRGINEITGSVRRPIVVLIILYELLVVQNPLQTLLSFWSE